MQSDNQFNTYILTRSQDLDCIFTFLEAIYNIVICASIFMVTYFYLLFYFVQPNVQSKPQKEGSESDNFWELLGGKTEYSSQKIFKAKENDPHLFSCSFTKGKNCYDSIFHFLQYQFIFTFPFFSLLIAFSFAPMVGCRRHLKGLYNDFVSN